MLLSSARYCYTLALLAFALILPTIRAVPYSKSTRNSILASLNKPQKEPYNVHTAGVPGPLKARGPGDQVGHPASLTHTMTKVPGSFKAVATIAPVREAAAALEDFFMDLYEAVQTTWSNQPRHRTVVYDNNGFSLLITAMGDTIPWEFVQQLALNGWTFAARGFTDLFDVMYANANGNIMVSVSLRLLDHALPGAEPGTGSGESSQTGWAGGADGSGDWREGSVPSVGSGADANNMGHMNWEGTR